MQRCLALSMLVAAGLLSVALGAAQQPVAQSPAAAALKIDKLRDNLFVINSAEASTFTGGNTAVFVLANGVLLVDTKIPGWGQPLIDKVKEITAKPITHVVNTHAHYDHSGGNPEFPTTVEIVTHENTPQLMKEGNPVSGLQIEVQNVFKNSAGRGLPKRTFSNRLTLFSGKDRVELYYFGRAHTSGDAFVVFPAARALHTGDAFPNKGVPIMDANNGGSGLEFAATLDKVAALREIDTVITGHGRTTLSIDDVREFADFNRAFVNGVRAAKMGGQTVDAFITSWRVPARFLKNGYTQPTPESLRSNAQVVWNELN